MGSLGCRSPAIASRWCERHGCFESVLSSVFLPSVLPQQVLLLLSGSAMVIDNTLLFVNQLPAGNSLAGLRSFGGLGPSFGLRFGEASLVSPPLVLVLVLLRVA